MPWYDYRCEGCGSEFELQRSIGRRDEADCPRCKSRSVRRLVRSVGVLAGGGGPGSRGTASCGPARRPGFT